LEGEGGEERRAEERRVVRRWRKELRKTHGERGEMDRACMIREDTVAG
jgi:hypothetical protein